MKIQITRLLLLLSCALAFGVHAEEADELASASAVVSPDAQSFCIFDEGPPADMKYSVVRKLKVGKGTYGGVKDILPKFVNLALQRNAHAVINYNGSQRFGFFPWRMVRPVVTGTAIRWADTPTRSCEAMGGSTLGTILATDQAPGAAAKQDARARPAVPAEAASAAAS